MTTIYVSAAREAKDIAKLFARLCEACGMEVPEQWWNDVPDSDRDASPDLCAIVADRQYRGIRNAQAFVCLTPGLGRGTQRETGMACALRRERGTPFVVLVGSRQDSHFDMMPGVDGRMSGLFEALSFVVGVVPDGVACGQDIAAVYERVVGSPPSAQSLACHCLTWACTTDEEWEAIGSGQHHPGCDLRAH